jgi:hypothetical protein
MRAEDCTSLYAVAADPLIRVQHRSVTATRSRCSGSFSTTPSLPGALVALDCADGRISGSSLPRLQRRPE